MGRDHHVVRPRGKGGPDHLHVVSLERIGVFAAVAHGLAFLLRAQICPHRVVELKVAAPGVVKCAHRLGISIGGVGEEGIEVGINVPADRGPAASKMQDGRRRNGHLGRHVRRALEESEVVQHGMVRETDLAGDGDALRLGLDAFELNRGDAARPFDPVKSGEEVEVPPGATELAIGHGLETGFFLSGDHVPDARILDFPKACIVEHAALPFRTGLLDLRRAQQAADLIGAKRCMTGHWNSPGVSVVLRLYRAKPGRRVAWERSRSHVGLNGG